MRAHGQPDARPGSGDVLLLLDELLEEISQLCLAACPTDAVVKGLAAEEVDELLLLCALVDQVQLLQSYVEGRESLDARLVHALIQKSGVFVLELLCRSWSHLLMCAGIDTIEHHLTEFLVSLLKSIQFGENLITIAFVGRFLHLIMNLWLRRPAELLVCS